jgi:hypothetical protein
MIIIIEINILKILSILSKYFSTFQLQPRPFWSRIDNFQTYIKHKICQILTLILFVRNKFQNREIYMSTGRSSPTYIKLKQGLLKSELKSTKYINDDVQVYYVLLTWLLPSRLKISLKVDKLPDVRITLHILS